MEMHQCYHRKSYAFPKRFQEEDFLSLEVIECQFSMVQASQ